MLGVSANRVMGEFWTWGGEGEGGREGRRDREEILGCRRKLCNNEYYNLSHFRSCFCVVSLKPGKLTGTVRTQHSFYW